MNVINDFLSDEELAEVINYHYEISLGLGCPVGLIKMLHRVPLNESEVANTLKYPIDNLHDRVQFMLGSVLEKTQ